MDNIHAVKKTTMAIQNKPLIVVLPYLDSIFLQSKNNLKIY